jgi:hypothetical protein
MVHLGANADLTSNTATGSKPGSITIKLIASLPTRGASGSSCIYQAALLTATQLTPAMVAWGTTLHPAPASASNYVATEASFTPVTPNVNELASLTGRCAFIIENSGGAGICTSCQTAAMGASKM